MDWFVKSIKLISRWIRALDPEVKITFFSFLFSFFLLVNVKEFIISHILIYLIFIGFYLALSKFKSGGENIKVKSIGSLFLIASFFTVLTSNGYISPFFPLFISSLLLVMRSYSFAKFVTIASLTFLILLLQAYFNLSNKSLSLLIFLSSLSFSLLSAFFLMYLRQEEDKENNKISILTEDFQTKTLIEKLWIVLDFEKAISKMHSEELIITEYFRQNPFCPPVCEFILVYRLESKIIFYEYDINNEKIVSSHLNLPFGFEKRKTPEKIYYNEHKEFKHTASNDFFAIYHRSETLKTVDYHLIELIDSIFVEVLAEARLSSYKNLLIEQLLGAENFLYQILNKRQSRELLENAVLLAKKIASVEKTFLIPCDNSMEGKPNLEKAIIKGPITQYPQDSWNISVQMLAEKVCLSGKPKTLETENFKIFALPIKDSSKIYGVLGGIANKEAKVERAISNAQFIANVITLHFRRVETEDSYNKEALIDKKLLLEYNSKIFNLQEIVHQLESKSRIIDGNSKSLLILKRVEQAIYKLLLKTFDEKQHKTSLEVVKKALTDIKEALNRNKISLNYSLDRKIEIEPKILRCVMIAIFEALANSLTYSNATQIEIGLDEMDGKILAYIRDNGTGFNLKSVLDKLKKDKEKDSGLKKIALEVKNVGGKLKIKSAPSAGTSVELSFNFKKDGN